MSICTVYNQSGFLCLENGFLCIGKSNTSFVKLQMAGLNKQTLKTKQFEYKNIIHDLRLSKNHRILRTARASKCEF